VAGNSFGDAFVVTTYGESHGPALGAIVDGCPAGLPLTAADLQGDLDRRAPGKSKYTTQRREPDQVEILSGVFEGVTTGTPIALQITNMDQRSRDYGAVKNQFRPAHADFTYQQKYGIRDYRGGGRSSARETAARVAAGSLARKVVPGMQVRAAMVQMGEKTINPDNWSWDAVNENPFFCPDANVVDEWAEYLDGIRKDGSSVGAIVEVVATGVPAGLGAPVYAKLDQEITSYLMSINAVKGVEIGNGFEAARITGVENADEMRMGKNSEVEFLSNQAGGILGGISTGQDVIARFAVKPTSSMLTPRKGVTAKGEEVDVVTKGRHDPCVGIRAVPIGEAMVACAVADHYLMHRGQTGKV